MLSVDASLRDRDGRVTVWTEVVVVDSSAVPVPTHSFQTAPVIPRSADHGTVPLCPVSTAASLFIHHSEGAIAARLHPATDDENTVLWTGDSEVVVVFSWLLSGDVSWDSSAADLNRLKLKIKCELA